MSNQTVVIFPSSSTSSSTQEANKVAHTQEPDTHAPNPPVADTLQSDTLQSKINRVRDDNDFTSMVTKLMQREQELLERLSR